MPRRPGPPPTDHTAFAVITLAKMIDETPSQVLAAARRAAGWGCGGMYQAEGGFRYRWKVEAWVRMPPRLIARLSIDGTPLAGLDHHQIPMMERREVFPPGYHWDLYPPLCAVPASYSRDGRSYHERVAIEPSPRAVDLGAALDLLCARWSIFLLPERQPGMPHG